MRERFRLDRVPHVRDRLVVVDIDLDPRRVAPGKREHREETWSVVRMLVLVRFELHDRRLYLCDLVRTHHASVLRVNR